MLDNKLTKTVNKKLATTFWESSAYVTETDPNSLGDPILDFESLLKGRANYYILENIAYAGINKSGVSHSVNTITPAFHVEKLLPYYPTSSTAVNGVCINTTTQDSIKHQFIITSGLFDSMSSNPTGPTTHVLMPGYRYSSSSLDTVITEAGSISYNNTIYYFIPHISTAKTCYLGIGTLDSCWSNCFKGPSNNPDYYPIQWVISNRIYLSSTYNYIVGVKNDGTSVVYQYSSAGVYTTQYSYSNNLSNTYGRLGSNFYDILAALRGYTIKGTDPKPSYAMGDTYSYSSWGYTLCNPNTINQKYNIHVWQNSYTKTYTALTPDGKFLGEYDGVAYVPLNNMGQYTSANTSLNLTNIYLYPGYLQSRQVGVNINYTLTVNSTPISITPTTGSKYLYILPKTSSAPTGIVVLIPYINSSGAWLPVYNATTAATNALAMQLEPTNYNYIIEVNYIGTGTGGVSAYVYSYDNNGIIDNRVEIGLKFVPLSE